MFRLSASVRPTGLAVILALNLVLLTLADGQEGGRRPRELVVNLKTARTLGLTIPQSVLLRADQVIE